MGDVIRLDMIQTSVTLNPQVTIYRPDETQLCDKFTGGSSLTVECALDVAGTYTILVGDLNRDDTGGYQLFLAKLN